MKYSQENFTKMYDMLKYIKQIYLSVENDSTVERSAKCYAIGSMVCHLLAEMEK